MIKFIKDNWMIPLLAIKNLFSGLVQVVWGLVSLGLFAWAMMYLRNEYPNSGIPMQPLPALQIFIDFILHHYNWLVIVFAIVYFYFDYKELRRVQDAKKEAKE